MWNVEIGIEAAQFPKKKENINGIFFAVRELGEAREGNICKFSVKTPRSQRISVQCACMFCKDSREGRISVNIL